MGKLSCRMAEIQNLRVQGGCIEQEHAQKRKKYNLGCSGQGSYLILNPISAHRASAPNLEKMTFGGCPQAPSHTVSCSSIVLDIGSPEHSYLWG